jgi:hypothetical protein
MKTVNHEEKLFQPVWMEVKGKERCKQKLAHKDWRVCAKLQVGGIGLEPTTFAMSKQCSNQLS